MKKKFRLACCLLAACGLFAFSGCAEFIEAFLGNDSSSEKSYAEDEWNPDEDATASQPVASEKENDEDSERESESMSEPTPDPEKELLRTETDEIGHKIAYYTDGTREDLGRVTPIDLTPVAPTNKEGYQYFAALDKGEGLCAFYTDLYNVACNFHVSTKNVTATGEHYEIADLRFSQHGLTSDEAVSVWRTVSVEYPEFFWWGNSVLLGRSNLTFLIDPVYAQASDRQQAQAAVEKMVETCDAYLDGTTSRVERALTIHDYVADITTYAYEDDYVTPSTEIWAHNIVGGALYGKGVCESYAKTYDYLCDLFALPCITATGYAVQDGQTFGHAWNVVQIDDGWYNVDITWNDLDSKTLSREWFGTDPDTFAETHDAFTPEDGWNVNYAFGLPTLDEDGLTPVRAANAAEISDGKYTKENAPMYPSIEDVCALLGEGLTYEAYLYPKTKATPSGAEIVLQGATLDRISHTAGTLVIVGEYRPYAGGYYELADLLSPDALTLQGDLVLRNVSYSVPTLQLGGKTLTTAGTAVELIAKTSIAGGNLVDTATSWTDVSANVTLDTLTASGKELRLLCGGTFNRANIHGGMLCLDGTQNVTIGTLTYIKEDGRLHIVGTANATQITIGDIAAADTYARVAITVAFSAASEYPVLRVTKKTTASDLYLVLASDYVTPQRLGKPFLNIGATLPLAELKIAYSWNGLTREVMSSLYERLENGDVCMK